ncbi:MAG: AbrB family transcriptional regulator [Thermoproteota archaeon]|uniref:AbrB/MazE/SpoVT family DNA-binding domain-containing protein n=1 Tax=Candidatus Methanodesulfokora washburnensis TaxID=2478471 RepID=A0A429GSX2_9CREN|nr:AbrB/MazE/SpoVT family DNA-binding domain-containing protein [Candidatus Methanodesulfokores washburnensis]RSN76924.1 AbrB/MazE/SpoVT family DNA-binding domain-containing protein [Candidatus Methanodesulfokores washburnensis]TDA41863.1 MAG: AbrB family transcriptional regulator [Candidatus Korarchaeota archaeon]
MRIHQCSITKVDGRGRVTLPKDIREKVNIKEDGKEGSIMIGKAEDPFKLLEKLLGDLSFDRSLRKVAEKQAMKEISDNEYPVECPA